MDKEQQKHAEKPVTRPICRNELWRRSVAIMGSVQESEQRRSRIAKPVSQED